MIWRPFKSLTRISSFFRKEILEVVRRPAAFISLVLGPFLIMAVFGAGYTGVRRPLETVLVLPTDTGLGRDVREYQELAGPAFRLVEITEDAGAARARLQRQEIDLVVVVPSNLRQQFRGGQQAVISVLYNQVDPLLANYAGFLAERLTHEVNRAILTRVVGQGREYLVRELGQTEVARIPPEVIAAPTRAELQNLAQTTPAVIPFFAPAVLALILQHMAVTLTSLSIVRDRLSGAVELFRVSPVSVREILIGKYLGFGVLTAVMGLLVAGLVVSFLGVPLKSDLAFFAVVSLLLIFASLGLGLLISVVADSERQAVQLSLLVLLASVFFSGLVLPIGEFHEVVRVAAHALPVTSGIRLLQDSMLRGGTYAGHLLLVLAVMGVAFFIATAVLLRRRLTQG
ncbi:MAG: ABC transporter permease [Chloroflexota bacterium]|nr:ABC transporter permease [Chloroflexota bacterium]